VAAATTQRWHFVPLASLRFHQGHTTQTPTPQTQLHYQHHVLEVAVEVVVAAHARLNYGRL
jgi:hypothetical protein